jgi:hypothetical protein
MSKWTHLICAKCWNARGDGRQESDPVGRPDGVCCFCGERTTSRIYVGHDGAKIACAGQCGH